MYYVYALYNITHKKIYIGQTRNIEDRLRLHTKKSFSHSFTAKMDGLWVLIYKEEVLDRSLALKREKQLKSYRGRQFIKQYIPR